MLGVIMALAIVLESHPSPDPTGLVNQLGSTRYALRIAAEGELARLGRSALPALREGKNSKDAEIRSRAISLLSRIENSLLLEATSIPLDFHEVPLPDVLDAMNRDAGLGLCLAPEERALLAERKITLRSAEPIPFWKAIDELCSAGCLHPGQGNAQTPGCPEGSFVLLDGASSGILPGSDFGPFRVQVASVHYQSEIQLAQPRPSTVRRGGPAEPVPQPSREFFLQLVLAAEPRLSVTRRGAVKVLEAVDDRRESLLVPADLISFQHSAGYFGMNPAAILPFRVNLLYPDSPAKRIKTLRGTIPVIVAVRKLDPLVVPLASSKQKVFQSDDAVLTLIDHRPPSENQPATVQLSIRPLGLAVGPKEPGNFGPSGFRLDSPQQQVEILDERGKALPWFLSSTIYNGEETQLTLSIGQRGMTAIPTTIRYYGILKANSEVPFEIRDIPIP